MNIQIRYFDIVDNKRLTSKLGSIRHLLRPQASLQRKSRRNRHFKPTRPDIDSDVSQPSNSHRLLIGSSTPLLRQTAFVILPTPPPSAFTPSRQHTFSLRIGIEPPALSCFLARPLACFDLLRPSTSPSQCAWYSLAG